MATCLYLFFFDLPMVCIFITSIITIGIFPVSVINFDSSNKMHFASSLLCQYSGTKILLYACCRNADGICAKNSLIFISSCCVLIHCLFVKHNFIIIIYNKWNTIFICNLFAYLLLFKNLENLFFFLSINCFTTY